MAANTLTQLLGSLASGKVRIVDLTQTLTPEFPAIELPPQFGQCAPYRSEEVSRYDERGPAWYWNNFSCNEHTGTHFDAPIHWVSGKDLPNNSVDTLPVENLIAPAVVVDCSKEAAANPDYLLTVAFVEAWEKKHGRIPPRNWFLMRTDWSKRKDPGKYLNMNETGQHTPGPNAELVQWLIKERDVIGFGVETIGTDAGQAHSSNPPYPCHFYMHGAGRYGLQCLTNLDVLPPQGAVVISPPLKLQRGSGSPLRVLALVES
jgi:kynurenine formamidase